MRKNLKKILLFFLLCSSLVLLVFTCFFMFQREKIIHFLSVNKPVNPEYLLVEGWISRNSMDLAVKEFWDKPYSKIIATGARLDPWYLMPVDGYFVFDFNEKPLTISSDDSLFIVLKGTPVKNIYPHFIIYCGEDTLAAGFTTGEWQKIRLNTGNINKLYEISLVFDNDGFGGGEDRNLYIKELDLGDRIIPARSEYASRYDKYDHARERPENVNYTYIAELCAAGLRKRGIPADSIIILPSEERKTNRTFNSALAVRNWYLSGNFQQINLNIFTENIHARRTWILYRMALNDLEINTGIISTPFNPEVKQHSKINSRNILRELSGIIYYKTIFNKGKYLKRVR